LDTNGIANGRVVDTLGTQFSRIEIQPDVTEQPPVNSNEVKREI